MKGLFIIFLILGSIYFLLKLINEIALYCSIKKKDKQLDNALKTLIEYQRPESRVVSGVCTVCCGSGYIVSQDGNLIDCPSCQKYVDKNDKKT